MRDGLIIRSSQYLIVAPIETPEPPWYYCALPCPTTNPVADGFRSLRNATLSVVVRDRNRVSRYLNTRDRAIIIPYPLVLLGERRLCIFRTFSAMLLQLQLLSPDPTH